ncbi:1-phosphofructokinase family hexose kinase [Microbacterium sp. JZ31]|uniref:1-phosphofructokinase family hexose kinase n=1 Tax=Microbacterium sp. JZ31 TaxID=1906274 RepID=UPI0019315C17|nr:1-phosphofructokinase family hexose kinase [Microbacterium sp. JZ31]
MIVTLTVNPALDRTVELEDALSPGDVQQAVAVREDAGGKGVNVARVLAGAGAPATAVLPLAEDDPYRPLLGDLPVRTVPIEGRVRANLTLTDPDGETTKINLPGPVVAEQEARALIDEVVAAADGADWLALCGSLPRGVPADFYVDVALAVRARCARPPRIAVDTSGPALAEAVLSGAVDLIKPNDEELVELSLLLDRSVRPLEQKEMTRVTRSRRREIADDPAAAQRIARLLVPAQVRAALITLGGDGAVLVEPDGAWLAAPPPTDVRSTVGAGDSALAGYLLAHVAGEDGPGRLRSAIRYGSATAALPGTGLATPADLPTGDIPVRALS